MFMLDRYHLRQQYEHVEDCETLERMGAISIHTLITLQLARLHPVFVTFICILIPTMHFRPRF